MDSLNSRPRLDDPKEFAIIREIYFNPERPLTDEADREVKRHKKQTNQAR